MSGTRNDVPAAEASRQGPRPTSYWRSSHASARSPVNAAVYAPTPRINVTDTSSAPGMVRFASEATRPRTPSTSVSASLIRPSSANASAVSMDRSLNIGDASRVRIARGPASAPDHVGHLDTGGDAEFVQDAGHVDGR